MARLLPECDPVVISGIGAATPIGVGADTFWCNLLAGASGVRPVRRFPVHDHSVQVACEVVDELPDVPDSWRDAPMYRASALLLQSAVEALADAVIAGGTGSTGLCVGTTMGETGSVQGSLSRPDLAPAHVEALTAGHHVVACRVARQLTLTGPLWTLSNACAAGNYAIARAAACIRAGEAEMMLAGGVDALSWTAFTGFSSLRVMAPERCQPFDRNRQGLLLGEGAAVLVLERRSSAVSRGARIYAEVLACGFSCDAHHIAQPDTRGTGAAMAMTRALEMGGVAPEEIDYISAHGTGTRNNDRAESLAIQQVFGDRALHVPVSSIKAQVGHTLGAASSIEAVACCLAIRDGIAPPTSNLSDPDPECPIDVVHSTPRLMPIRTVLSNAYAFGGNNSSLLLCRTAEGGRAS